MEQTRLEEEVSTQHERQDLCWVLTESSSPYQITAASDAWYALWQLAPEDVIGRTPKLLDGPGSDLEAGRMLMEQYASRGAATQRCINTKRDGALVKHTVSLVRSQGGLLAISTDMDPPLDDVLRATDEHPSLLDTSVRLTATMHAKRERRGAGTVSALDVAAAALDGAPITPPPNLSLPRIVLSHRRAPWFGPDAQSSRSSSTSSIVSRPSAR